MNIQFSIMCVLALFAVFAWGARRSNGSSFELRAMGNVGEKTHRESITKKADGAYARFLLVKFGSDKDHVALAGATDITIGTITDESAAAEDLVNIKLLGTSPETHKMVASEAIAVGGSVFQAANGKVGAGGLAASGQRFVGYALTSSAADGDIIEVIAHLPTAATARLVFEGLHTWAGGAAVTDAKAVAGVLATDRIIAFPNAVAGAGLLQKAVPTANTITFTTNANFANGDKIAYQVWR